jgi:hypothetical protein
LVVVTVGPDRDGQGNRTHSPARSRVSRVVLTVLGVLAALILVAAAGFQAPAVRHALATVEPDLVAARPTPTSEAPAVAGPRGTVDPPTVSPTATGPGRPSAGTPGTPTQPTKPPEPTKPPGPTKPSGPVRVDVPTKGSGHYVRAEATRSTSRTEGRLIRFDVRVEKGMPFDPEDAARFMATVLDDDRSWAGSGRWRFELVDDPDEAELHAWIVSAKTTDQKCYPLLTRGQVSCQTGNDVVLNATRWGQGAKAYGDDLLGYRRYLVNHEFGHYLGYQHVGCPGKGRRAPVMMQQTKSVGSCRPNSWPDPGRG